MIDSALELFKKFKLEFEKYTHSEITESDTRSKLLDKIFVEILGWNDHDINREGYVKPGYYDYEISTSNCKFIVEAKKSLDLFEFPEKGEKVKFKTLIKGNSEVIDQIRKYIVKRNLTYGVISNGHQFIIGRFVNTDGSDWEQNEAFVFRDLANIEDNFIKFYNLLSKEAIQKNGRIKFFLEDYGGGRLVDSLSIKNKNEELIRNDYSSYLYPIINQLFSEIYEIENLHDFEILKQCYIKNDDLEKHTSELNVLITDEPPKFDSRIIRLKNTQRTQKLLQDEITSQNHKTPDPTVIIGSKGAGKTTFIKYFIEVVLSDKIKNIRPIIYIDFRGYTKQQVLDTKAIYRKITNSLYDDYENLNLTNFNTLKKIYNTEIKRSISGKWQPFQNDPIILEQKISEFIDECTKNEIEHLEKISEYLVKDCSKRLVIILDNADQLGIEVQNEVYMLGQSLKRNLKALLLISLREGYYFKYKNKPPFDAFQSNVVHISAPLYNKVLESRIQFVIDNFDFSSLHGTVDNKKFQFSPSLLGNFFDNLRKTLFLEENSEILRFLEETSYPNIREGLEKFNLFLISGHTKITSYMTSSDFKIPIWEFIKAVALESRYYYHCEESTIKNIFNPTFGNNNHFTKIRILQYLSDIAEVNSYTNFHVGFEQMNSDFSLAGYNTDIISNEVKELIRFRMIETKSVVSDVEEDIELDGESEIKITHCGLYYLKYLLGTFNYIDLVLQDTPIYDTEYFKQLQGAFPISDKGGRRDIKGRLTTVKLFIAYLTKEEIKDHNRNDSSYGINALDWNIVESIKSNGLDKELTKVGGKSL